MQSSGATRRENVDSCLLTIPVVPAKAGIQ
jgi:hypothetical protein